jgi:hypothetical protein
LVAGKQGFKLLNSVFCELEVNCTFLPVFGDCLRRKFHILMVTMPWPHVKPAGSGSFMEWSQSLFKQRLDKALGFEWLQIIHIFANTNVAHGYSKLLLNANDDSAFGGAVQFG